MKHLKIFALCVVLVAAAACPAIADTGATGGIAYVRDLHTRQSYAAVVNDIGSVVRPLGTRLTLPVLAWAGTDSAGSPAAGFALAYRARIAENVTFTAGLATIVDKRSTRLGGFIVGATWRF